MNEKFVIVCAYDEVDGTHQYWSNDMGWVGLVAATVFTDVERHTFDLPNGASAWAELPADTSACCLNVRRCVHKDEVVSSGEVSVMHWSEKVECDLCPTDVPQDEGLYLDNGDRVCVTCWNEHALQKMEENHGE